MSGDGLNRVFQTRTVVVLGGYFFHMRSSCGTDTSVEKGGGKEGMIEASVQINCRLSWVHNTRERKNDKTWRRRGACATGKKVALVHRDLRWENTFNLL